jgi:hypothetical protein
LATYNGPVLSDAQQKRAWEGMLSAEIRANYFAEYSGRLNTRQRRATWGSLVLSSGAAASVLANLPESLVWIRVALTLATAGLSAYTLVMQHQKFATDALDLHARWNRLAKDFEALWDNVYTDNAQERLRDLEERASEISKAGAVFRYDKRRMLAWENHVVQHRLPHAA